VRLVTGPFAGRVGLITEWSGADRVKLIVWLLNRDIAVTVSAADIAVVE
jgi:hypothetical protein